MANTPFDDLGTEEILSTRISGIQDAVKNIEQSLNMDTEEVSNESLTLLADAMGRYRIAEAAGKRNWLDDPAPVIEQYIGGTWTQISTGFTIDYAGGAVIFADDKVGEQFRASFTRVKNTSGHNSHLSDTATQTIHAPALKTNLNLYVSPNGDDTTGDGSQAKPFRQITKALTVIPKNLNGYNAVINLAPGTYTGDLSVNGFFSGRLNVGAIQIVGGNSLAEAEDYIIDGNIMILQCSNFVLLKGVTVKNSVSAYYSTTLVCQYVVSEEAIVIGIQGVFTNVHILSCEISNKTGYALGIAGGILCAHGVSGDTNAVGYQAGGSSVGAGGIIIKTSGNTLTASTLDSKYGGSQIW